MGRMSRFTCGGYIADGFVNDCEELIKRCTRAEVLNYHIFCNVWKDMSFSQLFHGRTLGSELAELSEEVIFVAKRFLIGSDNMEESIAALFLVYALLNLQPYKGFAPLRVVPDDVVAIKKIELAARRDKRYDVLYILGSILIEGPVEYHAQPRDYGFEMPIRKYLTGQCGPDASSLKQKGVLSINNEELEVLREINSLSKKYSDAKSLLLKCGMWTDKLNYSNDNLASELEASYRKVLSGPFRRGKVKDGENSSQDSDSDQDVSDNLRAIKSKAMAIVDTGSKHRIGVEEKRKKIEAKNNLASPRPSTSKARLKKKKPALPPKLRGKKRFNTPMCEESSESDTTVLTASDNESDLEDLRRKNDRIKQIDKEILDTQNEISIQLDSLPIIISVDRDKELEIEIIDNMQPAADCAGEVNVNETDEVNVNETDEVNVTETDEVNVNEKTQDKVTKHATAKEIKNEFNKRKKVKSKSDGNMKRVESVEGDSPETKKRRNRKVSIEIDVDDPKLPSTRTSPRTKRTENVKLKNAKVIRSKLNGSTVKNKSVNKGKNEGSFQEPTSLV